MSDPGAAMTDYFQWEVRSWSRAYAVWHRRLQAITSASREALALGERDGGFSLLLADHGFRTVCSDLYGPTEQARALHEARGREVLITYATIDTLAIPYADASFDVVVFKSMIGALSTKERQRQAVAEMHRVLRPGGTLLFAENLQGTALHRWLRKRFVPWNTYWRYLDPARDKDLFEQFSEVELHATGLFASFGRTERQRSLIARLDALLMPLAPATWRTIWYGAAVKG